MFTINQNLIDDFADKINEKEKKSNKVTSLSSSSTNIEYPSAKAVYDAIDDLDIEWNDIQNKPALFSGSYADLTNKPSYTPIITSSTNGAYKIGSINISGSNVDIYGKDTDTHQDISGKENISNKTSSWNATTNNTRYPTEKLVKDSLDLKVNSADLSTVATTGDYDDLLNTPDELCIIDLYYDSATDELVLNTCSDQDFANITDKEDKSNKVTTWSATPNHIHYPTEKLVKDYIDDMIGNIIDYIEE